MLKERQKRDEFIEENLGLVHSICKRFMGRGIDYEDLYQTGCIGLIKAADGFDSERGLCFSTYAFPVIMGEVKRLFRDTGAIKVSRSLKELSLKTVRQRDILSNKLGREPTVKELADALCVEVEEITEALCVARPTVSLTYNSDDGVKELDLPSESLEDELSNKLSLDIAFETLSEKERSLMTLRYYEGYTQSKVAEALGMTQVQVSRTEKQLLKRLKDILD